MTFSDARSALNGKDKRGGYKGCPAFEFACPVCLAEGHDSKGNHGLAWDDGTWWHLCTCMLGHTEEQIQAAMGWKDLDRKHGTELGADPRPKPTYVPKAPPPAPSAPVIEVPPDSPCPPDNGQIWTYYDAKGRPALHKKKIWTWEQARPARPGIEAKPARWDKEFKQWNEGSKQSDQRGRKLLYNLPRVLEAVNSGATIYFNEGEKACDAFPADVVATCQPNGAGNGKDFTGKFTEDHARLLAGAAEVVIVADNDDVGEAYARYVYGCLKPQVTLVRIVRSKTTGPKDDAYDHLHRAGFGIKAFVPAPELEREASWLDAFGDLGLTDLSSVEAVDVDWLWYPYLPVGRPVLLDGDGDVGKSYMTLALASAILRGHRPDGKPLPDGPGRVLILASEDRADDTIVPRLESFGVTPAMRSRVLHVAKLFKFDPAGLARLAKMVAEFKPTLVIIDPVLSYVGATVNINAANEVRPILDAISTIMDQNRAVCILIRHTGKPPQSKDKRPVHHAGIGSVDIRNALRCQLVVQWHPIVKGLRVVTHEKHNLSEQGNPFGYQFREGQFYWLWDVKMPEATPALDLEFNRAKEFLERICVGQMVRAAYVFEEGKKVGISEKTLKRAKGAAGVVTKPLGQGEGRWHWTIPADPQDPYKD